jgi:hypothetical protein
MSHLCLWPQVNNLQDLTLCLVPDARCGAVPAVQQHNNEAVSAMTAPSTSEAAASQQEVH